MKKKLKLSQPVDRKLAINLKILVNQYVFIMTINRKIILL